MSKNTKNHTFGGALSSIKDQQEIEFLWQGDKNYWSGQAPVLFPICGSIRNDKAVTKDGKNLTMPRHGIVRKREFEEEETISVPEPVTETGLINVDNRTPLLNGERRLRLTHEMFHKDAVILDQLKSKSLSLYSERHGKEIRMEFGDFPYLILWSSANDGPFIAIEPWGGLSTCNDESDIFEEKRGVHMVEPGEEKRYHFDVMILVGCANGKSVATDFRQDI